MEDGGLIKEVDDVRGKINLKGFGKELKSSSIGNIGIFRRVIGELNDCVWGETTVSECASNAVSKGAVRHLLRTMNSESGCEERSVNRFLNFRYLANSQTFGLCI